ncbi:zinc finger, CCHC-type containing protein [Tanacetum coccineum]|uniref:Zinc finger, CCHC-type containing protein n=1 Tax=Tanacetum coccineum TaxID=301880 RepID=A0ABQ5CLA1_9ASTR
MKFHDVAFWKEEINDEMDSIMGNNTWVLTDLPPRCRPLGCKWIFKRKLKVDGTIEKFMERLVIQDFKQKSGIDYFDTYAPVARISTIRLLIAMTSIHSLIIHEMDVKTAFLNGELEEEIYMNQPLGFILPGNENKLLVSMGEFMHDDICEQIHIRLDVEDLIRCRSVCKSWKSLISHPRFVKAHHRRQVNLSPYRMAIIPNYFSKYNGPEYCMVGSSNGLACINSIDSDEIIVANPWTREERMLQRLPVFPVRSCLGFGYDALTDDYKVVFGAAEGFEKTAFHIGTLCNGALHWVMYSEYPLSEGLISFDLSKELRMTRLLTDLCHEVTDATRDKVGLIEEVKQLGIRIVWHILES